jgi:hypothetical protein
MGCDPGQRDRVPVLANCQLDTEVRGHGTFDVGGKGGQRRVERVVEAVAVEAVAVAEWMEVSNESCGEFRKKRTPSAELFCLDRAQRYRTARNRSCTDENRRLRRV